MSRSIEDTRSCSKGGSKRQKTKIILKKKRRQKTIDVVAEDSCVTLRNRIINCEYEEEVRGGRRGKRRASGGGERSW